MKNVLVEVTQGDIDTGIQGSGISCPVALAVRRTYGNRGLVRWVYACGSIYRPLRTPIKISASAEHSQRVRDFVEEFDCFGSTRVTPFSFTLTEDG